ncbi:uncharacterized protein LOC108140719 isoform X3 [Drosophila elegans]|uniref:uncharacterized protein LOC108140719 isoform X3 n=1 Tax=Drosophila elegans TaxID=30023 RepID=UPI0007E75BDA|nr:uncharacterized protein LOC108140719 isoform X3 [Drosophila elegans]
MRYICRTCSRMADPAAAKNIFEPSSASVLQQIETLTNLQLKKDDKLPRFMCQECQRDLQIAIDFRRVCIEAQELLELQLKQVEKEEEALESLAEQWLDDCPEEFPDLRSDPQDKEEDKTLIGHVTQDEDALETMSIASMELLNTTVCKEKFLPEDSPHVLPEFSADSQLSEENFDLLLSPEAELPESEAIDDPDSSSHTCSKCGLDFDDLDELRTHKYHLHDVPLNSKRFL